MGDFVPGYETSAWQGIGAPKNTSAEIVEKLNKEVNAGLADPKMKARFAELGNAVIPGSPADFGKLIPEETVLLGGLEMGGSLGVGNQGRETLPESGTKVSREALRVKWPGMLNPGERVSRERSPFMLASWDVYSDCARSPSPCKVAIPLSPICLPP